METLLFSAPLTAAAANEPATWLVCLLGVTVVFVGLIAIIGILYLMNYLVTAMENKANKTAKEEAPVAPVAPTAPAVPAQSATIPNRQEIIAAVVAAVAEENGTDISAIRVISFKKL